MTASQITRDTMFTPLLAADPSFQSRWIEFLDQWGGEQELPLYIALSSLADHLVERLAEGQTEGFQAIFDVVERWHVEGNKYVAEAASVGLLESLQNLWGGNDRAITVEQWLGPETRRWWDKLDRFWQGDREALSS